MRDRRRTSHGAYQRPRRPPARAVLSVVVLIAACETDVVSVVDVSDIEVSPSRITVIQGGRDTATVTLKEAGGMELAGRSVTWSSDDPAVATVSEEGIVEGRAPGETWIRASSGGVTGSAEIHVLPGPEIESGACHIRDRTFNRDVVIPRNTTCTFTNVRVRGDLELARGAALVASFLRVEGGVEGGRAGDLVLRNAHIEGDIELEDGGSIVIRDSYVGGDVQIESNRGHIDLRDSTFDSDVEIEDNRGGPFTLFRNTIDGELECRGNNPSPRGGGNVARGGARGQCRVMSG